MKVPAYFEREVEWDKLFASHTKGGKLRDTLQLPTKENAERWASKIYCALSPENLHCDGEISRSAAAKKARELNSALSYLENLVGHKLPERY